MIKKEIKINSNIGKLPLVFDHFMRNKVYNSLFWKEKLAGINEEELIELAINLKYIGGSYGPYKKPTKFLCFILKMLQMNIDLEIIQTMIDNPNYKYLTILGLFYLRLIGDSINIYLILEDFYKDYRKINYLNSEDKIEIIHIDEIIHKLLNNDYFLDITLLRLIDRKILEEQNKINIRKCLLNLKNETINLKEIKKE